MVCHLANVYLPEPLGSMHLLLHQLVIDLDFGYFYNKRINYGYSSREA